MPMHNKIAPQPNGYPERFSNSNRIRLLSRYNREKEADRTLCDTRRRECENQQSIAINNSSFVSFSLVDRLQYNLQHASAERRRSTLISENCVFIRRWRGKMNGRHHVF